MRRVGWIVLALCSALPAQLPESVRGVWETNFITMELRDGLSGGLHYDPLQHPGEFRWLKNLHDAPTVWPVPLVDFRLGTVRHLTFDRLLVSGAYTRAEGGYGGVLMILALTDGAKPTIDLEQMVQLAKSAPWSADYDEQAGILYYQDITAEELRFAPWTGLGTPMPTVFQVGLEATQVPQLSASYYKLWRSAGEGVMFFERRQPFGTLETPRYRLTFDPKDGVVAAQETLYLTENLADPAYSVRHRIYVAPDRPIRVKGPGGAFVVRDIDSGVIAFSGSLPFDPMWWATDDSVESTWHVIAPPAGSLESGRRYRIEADGHKAIASPSLVPTIRYGTSAPQPLTIDNVAHTPAPADFSHDRVTVGGEALFGCDLFRDVGSDPEGDELILGTFVHMNLRLKTVSPPVEGSGKMSILTPEITIGPSDCWLAPGMRKFSPPPVFIEDIPNTSELSMYTVWVQVFVFDPANPDAIGWSDIIGMPIRPAKAVAAAVPQGQPFDREAVMQAAVQCLATWSESPMAMPQSKADTWLKRVRKAAGQ